MTPDVLTHFLKELMQHAMDPDGARPPGPPAAWILAGPPASGKTTLARHLQDAAPTSPLHVENDALRPLVAKTLTGAPPRFSRHETNATYRLAHRVCAHALANGQPIIHDATNLTPQHRAPLLEAARCHEATPRLVILETPRNVRHHRAQDAPGAQQAHAALGTRTPTETDAVPILRVDGTKPPNQVARTLLDHAWAPKHPQVPAKPTRDLDGD